MGDVNITYCKETGVLNWRIFNCDGTPMFNTKYENMSLADAQAFADEHNYGMLDVI